MYVLKGNKISKRYGDKILLFYYFNVNNRKVLGR